MSGRGEANSENNMSIVHEQRPQFKIGQTVLPSQLMQRQSMKLHLRLVHPGNATSQLQAYGGALLWVMGLVR